jgi:hypothetical protein
MSQNGPFSGPPWPGGGSNDEPYAEPSDPWGDHAVSDASWPASPPSIPHQPAPSLRNVPQSDPAPSPPPASWGPPRRNTPIVALVVVLGLLIVAGLGAIGWLVKDRIDSKAPSKPRPTASSATTNPPSSAQGSEDARFATAGQCVQNLGTDDQPDMRRSACTTGTYRVLKVFKGKSSGAKDAEGKCSKVPGYTNWFYYDSDLDDLDLVLCLKKQ